MYFDFYLPIPEGTLDPYGINKNPKLFENSMKSRSSSNDTNTNPLLKVEKN